MTQGGATLDLCHYLSIVESNNEISHALLYRIGTFPEYKEAMRKYFTMTDDEIDPKYYQDNYYCTRMMMDTLKYLYARQDEFPELIDYMKQSIPQNNYFKAKVTEMEVAHKYGSFEGCGKRRWHFLCRASVPARRVYAERRRERCAGRGAACRRL